MDKIYILIILFLILVVILFFNGILVHKKAIAERDERIKILRQMVIDQLKKTIQANNENLILQEEYKKFKRKNYGI